LKEQVIKKLAKELDYKLIKKSPKISFLNKIFLWIYFIISISFIALVSSSNQMFSEETIKFLHPNLWKITLISGILGTFYIASLKRFKFTVILDGIILSIFFAALIGIKYILLQFGIDIVIFDNN